MKDRATRMNDLAKRMNDRATRMKSRRWLWIASLFALTVLGFGPMSSWLLRNEIRRSIGIVAQIDSHTIKRADSAWLAPGLSLSQIGAPHETAVRCQRAWFQLSWPSLLSRRLRFNQVMIEQATLPTPIDRLPQVDLTEQISVMESNLSRHGFPSPGDTDWNDLLKDLNIESTSKTLKSNWSKQLSDIESKLASMEESVAKMRRDTQSLENPLRNKQTLQASDREVKRIRQLLPKLETELNEQCEDVRKGESLLEEASAKDKILIANRMQETADQVGLLSDAFAHRLIAMQLESLRKFGELGSAAISLSEIDPAGSSRGREFFVNEAQSTPAWQVDRILINGNVSIDGQMFPFRGRMEHLVPNLAESGLPTTVQFRIDRNGQVVFVGASRLFAIPNPIDIVDMNIVDAPNTSWLVCLPQFELIGTGGKISTWINWERADRDWKCVITFRNSQVSLSVASPNNPNSQDLVDQINESLANSTDLDITASILFDESGHAKCDLKSNFAQSLDVAFAKAISNTLGSRQATIDARYVSMFGNTFETLRSDVDSRNRRLIKSISSLKRESDELSTEITARIDPRNDDRFSRIPTPNRIVR